MILANNRSTKLRTLICSVHARTVRPTGADRPDRGPRAQFWFEHHGSFRSRGANNRQGLNSCLPTRTLLLLAHSYSWTWTHQAPIYGRDAVVERGEMHLLFTGRVHSPAAG
jgi:hypothetical protein